MIIHTEKLKKIYRVGPERIHALDGIDLDIESNEFVAIMGSSGSGKSTLMNLLGCLDRPTSGRYILSGHDTRRLSATELALIRNEHIGFIFQSFELMSRMSALRNVEMPLLYSRGNWSSRGRKAKAALERVGLGERSQHRPSQPAGGQTQRVALARAITAVENETAEAAGVLRAIQPHLGHARVQGFTGPPGAGKSTLVDADITELRKLGMTVGAIAVEPSSPVPGGAILGDRVRLSPHHVRPFRGLIHDGVQSVEHEIDSRVNDDGLHADQRSPHPDSRAGRF